MYRLRKTFQQTTTSPGKTLSWSDRAWASTAITLGVWETVALTTKKVPTISSTCWMARKKNARGTEAAIILWLAGLGAHLLKRAAAED